MAEYQVTCVTTREASDTGITHIGSNRMRWTKREAIAQIKTGVSQFFTRVGGVRANVLVRKTGTTEYLTTDPDGKTGNNLLSLPGC